MDALYRQNDYLPDTPATRGRENRGKPRIMNKTWQLVELYGCWWAYEGGLPPPEAFRTHGHEGHILGPFPTRAVAEARLHKHRSGRGDKAPANRSPPPRRGWS